LQYATLDVGPSSRKFVQEMVSEGTVGGVIARRV
jgi:hypothetical protein